MSKGKIKKSMFIFASLIFLLSPFSISRAVSTTSTGATTVSATYEIPGCNGCNTGDTTKPASVSDLSSGNITSSSVTLNWTAPGDDGNSGTATQYDLRYYTYQIVNESDWNNATVATGLTAPHIAGTLESFVATGLSNNTHYYFAIKTKDKSNNWSDLSNNTDATTGSPDSTAPEISNVNATNITGDSATINWTTNENADSKVVFGTDSDNYGVPIFSSQLQTAHSLNLSDLTSQTKYFYRVVSKDVSNNFATSSEYNFTTTDLTAPIISDVSSSNITGVSARIIWTTNEAASSTVILGTTSGNYNLAPVFNNDLVSNHTINLKGLTPNTTYYYKVKSADAGFNESVSDAEYTFQTLDTVAPIITNVQVIVRMRSATITWQTDKNADSQIAYGITSALGSLKSSVELLMEHSVSLGNLDPNTHFYFVARSVGAHTTQGSSELLEFTTLSDSTPPANVSNASATAGDGVVDLSWTNPPDSDFDGVLIKSSTTDYPRSSLEGTTIYQGSGTRYRQSGLTNGVLIYYTIFAYDTSNNYASGALLNATPSSIPIITPPKETPTVPIGGDDYSLKITDFVFTVAKGKIIVPSNVKMSTLVNSGFAVSLDAQILRKQAKSALLNFNNSLFLMSFDETQKKWKTEFTVPAQVGSYNGDIIVTYQDDTVSHTSWQADVLAYGQIVAIGDDGIKSPLLGAKVSLLAGSEMWPAGAYGQTNPQITDESGSFGFLVPSGKYILRVEKEGFHTEETGNFDSNGVVINRNMELLATPPTLKDVIKEDASLAENAQAIVKNLGQKTIYEAKIIKNFVSTPVVQDTTKNIVAPTVAGAVAVGTTAAIGFSQLLLYLRFLFTQPLLLFQRRKRRGWGVVYNSLTKMPLDLVIIRLVDIVSNRVAQSRVTDKDGRYAFLPEPGRYRIEIQQLNFVYPSNFFASLKEDFPFVDLYHGEEIEVKEKGAILTPNIPLDPGGAEAPIGKILWRLIWRRFQNAFSVVSIILSIGFFVVAPSILTGVLGGVQVILYVVFLRLAYPKHPKSWGIIYDEHTKRPLREAVVRVFDEQYNKLLETQITDHRGRYSFLVGRNSYYVMSEKNGYEKKKSQTVDLREIKDAVASLGVDLGLKKTEMGKGMAIVNDAENKKPPFAV